MLHFHATERGLGEEFRNRHHTSGRQDLALSMIIKQYYNAILERLGSRQRDLGISPKRPGAAS
jgi:hypothetical protein